MQLYICWSETCFIFSVQWKFETENFWNLDPIFFYAGMDCRKKWTILFFIVTVFFWQFTATIISHLYAEFVLYLFFSSCRFGCVGVKWRRYRVRGSDTSTENSCLTRCLEAQVWSIKWVWWNWLIKCELFPQSVLAANK